MSVKASELPDLIAAAVKKAVAEQHLTDASISDLLHRPITIGIIARPEIEPRLAVKEGERVPFPLRTIGFVIDNLDELKNLSQIQPVNEGKAEGK